MKGRDKQRELEQAPVTLTITEPTIPLFFCRNCGNPITKVEYDCNNQLCYWCLFEAGTVSKDEER